MTPDRTSSELVELLHPSRPPLESADSPLMEAWREAEAEAEAAYDAWHRAPGTDAYVVYLAAEDRAAAAQDELANWLNSVRSLSRAPQRQVA
jgi:hypothetical protein